MPPHFGVEGNLTEDKDIEWAMHNMFSPVLERFLENKDMKPTGLLLLSLASVIFHSDWLRDIVTESSGHPFSLIPLLNCPKLLGQLKEKVRKIIPN